jgi:hypothetical protein
VRDGLRPGQRRLDAPETYIAVRRNPNYDPRAPRLARVVGCTYGRLAASAHRSWWPGLSRAS